jgi:AcrR family transcriptional regulator
MSRDLTSRREAMARATRSDLLAAARAAFAERGYADASLGDIARRARATTGALYHHFADKRAIFAAVAEEIEAELVDQIERSAPPAADAWTAIEHAIGQTLAFASRPGIARIIFRDAPTVLGAQAWHEIEMRHAFGRLHGVLTALSDANQLGGHDPSLVTGIILGALVQTVAAIAAADNDPQTLRAATAAMQAVPTAFRHRLPSGASQAVARRKRRA